MGPHRNRYGDGELYGRSRHRVLVLDGRENTTTVAALGGAYDAAKHCANLMASGNDDGYLPAQNELAVLYTNSSSIGGFQSAIYWSSSEYSVNVSRIQNFSDGAQNWGR